MNSRFKPISRLSIVFILAMVLSGGILTYFSINNISNLKELTEKRILEEQRELSARFSIALQNNMEKLTAGFKNDMDQVGLMKDSLINTAADHDFIIQAFILKNNGEFIFPNFTGIPENLLRPIHSARFKAAFELGEKAEFAEKDLVKAKGFYLSCLSYSTVWSDSVKVLNALGRISVKLNHIEDATAHYSSIILDYFSLSDRDGFPYAYYALFHLLNNANADNLEIIVPLIAFSLDKMACGTIPLNFHTEELLMLVTNWLGENTLNHPGECSHMNRVIAGINQQVHFVNLYGYELSGITKERNTVTQYTDSNGFKIIHSFSGSNRKFFLVKKSFKNTTGFLLDRNSLFDSIVKTGLQDGLEFGYIIEFPTGYISSTAAHSLSYFSQLNPYFPEQFIQINIENEDLITDIIKRRSWIYGIASVLLLLAMLLGVVLILRDIAREKHLANLRSDFISNVTHELKTPLTSIRMYAESLMMRRVKSVSGQRKYLSVVVNESERLKRMINNILEFSKMEKAKQEYHPVESNLSEILHAAILDMNYWLEKKGFNLITEIDRDIKVKVDPEKFYQVYSNLLSNAIKYSGDSRKIFVRLHKNSGSVITEVEDEGIGIEDENLTKIFEEFFRVERNDSGNITGTGLGLTVVKEIVEAHGGKILVDSEIGKGSKISVILFQQ
jgi:signal transduction histidine kinase